MIINALLKIQVGIVNELIQCISIVFNTNAYMFISFFIFVVYPNVGKLDLHQVLHTRTRDMQGISTDAVNTVSCTPNNFVQFRLCLVKYDLFVCKYNYVLHSFKKRHLLSYTNKTIKKPC